jgi:hypothetical protein
MTEILSSSALVPAAEASAYYLFYFNNNVQKKHTAYEVEEVYQALNEQFDQAVSKKGVKLNDPTWNYRFFKDDVSKICVSVSVSYIHFHRDPKGPERKWMKLTKFATISKKTFCVRTEMVEEEFPKQIPYFFDNNQKDIKYANSLDAILNAYQSHMFLSMPNFGSEQDLHMNVFNEVDNDDRDRVMSEWAFTYFAPYERKWIRLTRKVAYRIRSPVLSMKF